MNVVLVEPEIPPNTGNVARLCAATNSTLHLIGPLGFQLDDRQLKRAGMDYWDHVTWKYWNSWEEFCATLPPHLNPLPRERGRGDRIPSPSMRGEGQGEGPRLWLVENKTDWLYTQVEYRPDDYLIFGRETTGLSDNLLEQYRDSIIAIPQFNPNARSLNLSNCVAIVLYEAIRQFQKV
ncbi:MAG: tRNA (cytidine(34)-2'-O)-methyltransferase [Verrucomicrobiota bacterium]